MPKTRGRLTEPMVRENGTLRPASWDEAPDVAAAGHGITLGNLCIKGRVGFQHVNP